MKMPSRILWEKVNMEVIKLWITISWACCTVSVYHVASSERCILMVGAKIPYNTRFFGGDQTFQGRLFKTVLQVSILFSIAIYFTVFVKSFK
ncbi:unnamed protein product [Musa hybrid cultivar]